MTDLTAPSTAALARISDTRATQYWDRRRGLSRVMGEHDRAGVVWDYIAVYAPGTKWEEAPPKAVYAGHPVFQVIAAVRDAIEPLMTGSTHSLAGEK